MDINTITFTGRVTRQFDLKTTHSGKSVVSVPVAINGRQDDTVFIDVIMWEKTAEFASKNLTVGSRIAVTGRLQRRKWQTKEGENRYAVEIIANQVQFVGGADSAQITKDAPIDIDDNADDILSSIPF